MDIRGSSATIFYKKGIVVLNCGRTQPFLKESGKKSRNGSVTTEFDRFST